MNKGSIYAISIGHSSSHITDEAKKILTEIDVIAGHPGFIQIASKFLKKDIDVIDNNVTRANACTFEEAQQNRVSACTIEALKGRKVGILSGGDTGVWGEAGFFFEAQKIHDLSFDVHVIPGVSGVVASAARCGAPLMNGYALISLGDEDTPFSIVEKKLLGAAIGGFVIVLYKVILESYLGSELYPSNKYPELSPPDINTKYRIAKTYEILSKYISPETPMAIITDAYNQTSNHINDQKMLGTHDGKEEVIISKFSKFVELSENFKFLTTVIIGEEATVVHGNKIYTPQWNYNWYYNESFHTRIKDKQYLKPISDFNKSLQIK